MPVHGQHLDSSVLLFLLKFCQRRCLVVLSMRHAKLLPACCVLCWMACLHLLWPDWGP